MYGWQGTFTQMGWFFTKAALLTFGGAYAVLPYVYLGAVEHYQSLTPHQMIDGPRVGRNDAPATYLGYYIRRFLWTGG